MKRNISGVRKQCSRDGGGWLASEAVEVFLMPEVYLAHRINKEVLQPTDDKVRAVREFPQPGRVGRLKAVLWMLSFTARSYQQPSPLFIH